MPSRRTLRASFQVKKEPRKCGTVIPHCNFSKERIGMPINKGVLQKFSYGCGHAHARPHVREKQILISNIKNEDYDTERSTRKGYQISRRWSS